MARHRLTGHGSDHAGEGGALSTVGPSVEVPPRRRQRAVSWVEHGALAVIAFVPQLLTKPGVVVADTKAYLYLDIGRFLRESATLWTPNVDLGSVTYQQIGYLFPMGPFFWLVHALGIPVWVGERLWVGALLFGAGTGVLYLCRTVRLDGPGRPVAALAFMLSPYFLQYLGRESELLLPWAGLGWMLALTMRAVRSGGWRYPALLALVWVTVSGTNATAALLALLPPAIWLLYCVLVTGEHTWRQMWSALWRMAVLAGAVSVWWVAALAVEGRYGVNVLLYTESVSVEALTSLSSEVLRGLGYWYFYGQDILGTWQPALTGFTQQPVLIAATFAVPVIALAGAAVIRWRLRAYFVLVIVVALIVAVGTHPFGAPSAVGALFKDLLTTKVGNALRSSDRAAPAIILALAMLLGAGLTALTRRMRPAGITAAVVSVGLVAAANPAVWNGTTAPARYSFATPLPKYVTNAAKALDSEHKSTRVLAIPGQTFGAYTFGTTLDPVWPGVLTRPFVERQQLPGGSLPTFDLLYGLDNPMQTGSSNPAAIAPLARLMSVGDVLVQNDLQYDLYDEPNPRLFWQSLIPVPAGLGKPTGYGKPAPNLSTIAAVDAPGASASPSTPTPAPVEVLPVENPRPVVRAESTSGDLVVDGDGVGLDAVSGIGLLNTDSPVLYAQTLDAQPKALADAMSGNATLVVTDSNRRENFFWGSVQNNAGITLESKQSEAQDALDIFPGAPADSQSTADIEGVRHVVSSVESAQDSPAWAMDGNPDTAWESFSGAAAADTYWQVRLAHKVTTDEVRILQPTITGYNYEQWITKAKISFDGHHVTTVTLGPSSRSGQGQIVHFKSRKFRTLTIYTTRTNLTDRSAAVKAQSSPVGLAEVGVGNARVNDVLEMPGDLLAKVGPASKSHRVVLVMTRDRVTPVPPHADPDPTLERQFSLPTKRTFTVSGQVRLSNLATDATLDTAVGRLAPGSVVAYSSSRLADNVADTASAALDGNPSTMWSPASGIGSQKGSWIQVNLPRPVTFGHMDLQVLADGLHSLPTNIQIRACSELASDQRCPSTGSQVESVALPQINNGRRQGTNVGVPINFPDVTGKYLTFTFTGVHLVSSTKYLFGSPVALPLGIAELGIPGVSSSTPPASMPGGCRSDLLNLDDHPVFVQVTGSTREALDGGALQIAQCGPDASGIALGAGSHFLTSTPGQSTGFEVDQLVLDSAAGGGPSSASSGGQLEGPTPGPTPTVKVVSKTTTSFHVKVTGANGPFWLVLGESKNSGWKATTTGDVRSVTPALIDGFANGWLVDPGRSTDLSFTLHWTPQSVITPSLLLSAAAVVLCLGIVLSTRRRRLRATPVGDRVAGDVTALTSIGRSAMPENSTVPVLVRSFGAEGEVPIRLAISVAVGSAIVSAAIVPVPVAGVLVGAGVLLALLSPKSRWLLGAGAVVLAAAAGAYVAIAEAIEHYVVGGWPLHFNLANDFAWISVVLIAADVVVGLVPRSRE